MLQPTKTKITKKKVLIAAGVVLALALAAGSFWYVRIRNSQSDGNNTPDKTATDNEGNTINLDPPTDEDLDAVEQHKDELVKQAQNQAGSNGQKISVTPVISSADMSGVYAYVPGVFEDGGTCTAKFSQGGQQFTRSSKGFRNAQSTNCEPITTQRSDFPATGTWQITVSYDSAKASGGSQSTSFEVK